jgi:hypothetical protein
MYFKIHTQNSTWEKSVKKEIDNLESFLCQIHFHLDG